MSLPVLRHGVRQMPALMVGCRSISAATANEQDIIGALPDSVLLYILSFLPTLDAVRTSVLSRRWRYLWTSIGTLDLDDFNKFFYLQSPADRKMTGNKFKEFVDKVLTFHHAQALQSFRLSCCDRMDYPVEDWIHAVVTRNAHELDLCLSEGHQLPSCLFVSHSLVDLKLDLGDEQLRLPAVLDLPGLRSLHLENVSFSDAHLINKLLASCRALRRLAMVEGGYWGLESLEISSPLLESLTIVCQEGWETSGLGYCQLKIFAPQLTYFEYRAPFTQVHALKPLSSLVNVVVELYGGIDEFDVDVQGFFHQLSSAKNLKIYHQCVEAMWTIPSSPMHSSFPFHSLKHLKVSACLQDDKIVCIILRLLVANPCLSVLSLEDYGTPVKSRHGYTEGYLEIFNVYSEQVSGVLEDVEITCLDLSDLVLHLVKVLLAKEASLKKLFFNSHSGPCSSLQRPNKRKRLLQKVLSFPRRSCNLVVAFL